MITLYTFGPWFGLPDGSPFVTKAMILLKMAGLAYQEDRGGYFKAPKGKLPWIDDDGAKIADTTLIRMHIERKYGFDYDAGLSAEQKAIGWAVEKICEDHVYWFILQDRWLNDANFARGPAHFFDAVPVPLRPLVRALVRRKVRRDAWGQGLARHSAEERKALAVRAVASIATLLGDKPFLSGEKPCGADAALGAFVLGGLCPLFDSPLRAAAESAPNIVAYGRRISEAYFKI
jgi:glutathione S-transferase